MTCVIYVQLNCFWCWRTGKNSLNLIYFSTFKRLCIWDNASRKYTLLCICRISWHFIVTTYFKKSWKDFYQTRCNMIRLIFWIQIPRLVKPFYCFNSRAAAGPAAIVYPGNIICGNRITHAFSLMCNCWSNCFFRVQDLLCFFTNLYVTWPYSWTAWVVCL